MKRHLIFPTLCLGAAALSPVLFGGCSGGGGNKFENYDAKNFAVGGGSAAGISQVEIEWAEGNVLVQSSSSASMITFSEQNSNSSNSLKLRYSVGGGKLELKFAAPGASYPAGWSKDLTVTIPASMQLSRLDIETIGGEVNVRSIGATDIKVEAVSAAVTVDGCTFSESEVQTESGNVTYLLGDRGFRCEFTSASGSIYDSFGTSSSGNVYTYGEGGISMEVTTKSGGLWLKRKS